MIYFLVGLGGVAGSLCRYLLSAMAVEIWGKDFPYGTLTINLTGAFLLGFITNQFSGSNKLHPYLYTALTTGVIGSYTTFSTFCLETVHLLETGKYIFGLLYVGVSFFGGLLVVRAGMTLSERAKRLRRVL
ncbi:fluoride efflux transporter CrcB [Bacillus sp. sid0103]|uniref:fluoride efflux transporter CrcB n=1 Tax=Bacillus sp. sid0103 TaxID=2856337 RepID=UPI001C43EBC5|nr:fluoride efflux transporter CrcB [Bacillus sp. sid0103]MBV7506835.1 fluoride efflux transporter CrcB [Bacillus sp. sid0103]